MGKFCMPSLGADMEAGTLVEWCVKTGDRVSKGDIIAVVDTDKGSIEVEVWEDGIVEQLLVEPGTQVPVETPLAIIGSGRMSEPQQVKAEPVTASREQPAVAAAPRVKASPLARKMADNLGLDLTRIEGHGPGGVIQKADILKWTEAEPTSPPPERRSPPARDGIRRAVASAMSRSNREIPHYYVKTRIDMSRALDWLCEYNREVSARERLLPVALLARAVVLALKKAPELNGFWRDSGLQKEESVHLGLIVSLREGGIVNPALRDAEKQTLSETMAGLSDLIERSRRGRLRSSEMNSATITLTNLGDRGVEEIFGVIYPPQVALVGLGAIREQPWAEKGLLGVRPILTATLAGDHRATDGRTGARFLEALDQLLQQPEKL